MVAIENLLKSIPYYSTTYFLRTLIWPQSVYLDALKDTYSLFFEKFRIARYLFVFNFLNLLINVVIK